MHSHLLYWKSVILLQSDLQSHLRYVWCTFLLHSYENSFILTLDLRPSVQNSLITCSVTSGNFRNRLSAKHNPSTKFENVRLFPIVFICQQKLIITLKSKQNKFILV